MTGLFGCVAAEGGSQKKRSGFFDSSQSSPESVTLPSGSGAIRHSPMKPLATSVELILVGESKLRTDKPLKNVITIIANNHAW